MTTPTNQKSAPTVTADHTSTHWAGGQAQLTNSWCFAAAEAIVQAGFGGGTTQAEIAHIVLMARGMAQDNAQHGVDYFNAVQDLFAMNGLDDTSWASVGALVTADQTLNGYLRNSWGTPPLTGRTYTGGGRLTADEIITTLDANGLVMSGNNIHWKVIYGYRRYSDGSVQLRVYDPWNGTAALQPAGTVTGSMQVSYRVTA